MEIDRYRMPLLDEIFDWTLGDYCCVIVGWRLLLCVFQV
jgi:hypothetical protein